MKQVVQKLKEGKVHLIEVPPPQPRSKEVLVRNYFSCISVGTESSTVKAAQKGYIGKAKERPQQFQEVINKAIAQGPVQAYRAVMKKLDAYSSLGYSSVGRVIEVGSDVRGFSVGDYTACAGGTAHHAEIVAVPENLCVRIDQHIDLKQATYNTLGAIAMQGVRQAGLQLNESCAVIGLGLLGQLTCVLLKASGVNVVGVDIDPGVVSLAAQHCADLALRRDVAGIEQTISSWTSGMGCDAVIITASATTSDPINFAGTIVRKRGTIVVVGAVPTGFDREPHFYQKELAVKMSCSYGPGRYDPTYEEQGNDYPYAYVRWTEKRNMSAFQDLIKSGRIDIRYLTTHVVKLDDAPRAYQMIVERSEPHAGVLIEYDTDRILERKAVYVRRAERTARSESKVTIGFIGAGSYAQGHLLPNIPRSSSIVLNGVMTGSAASARSVAERFHFDFCTTRAEDILENEEINTIFIATRHETHGSYAIKALKAGKNVFVEKPLCLSLAELEEIDALMESRGDDGGILMVGYNRRYSPLTFSLKKVFKPGPMALLARVNAGFIPAGSWIQDLKVGGGRILGEVCHFIDYLTHVSGSIPGSVYAAAMDDPSNCLDTVTISLRYLNGSVGSINYFANGSQKLPKEYFEFYQSGTVVSMTDFEKVVTYDKGKPKEQKLLFQDKGQKSEVKIFLEAVIHGTGSPIPYQEIRSASKVSFGILESIKTGKSIEV